MGFIDKIKERAKANKQTIVLPETEDRRTYEAVEMILKEGIANVVLVGSEAAVAEGSKGLDISGATVVDPATSDKTASYIDKLVELRQAKGMTEDQAKELLLNNYLYYLIFLHFDLLHYYYRQQLKLFHYLLHLLFLIVNLKFLILFGFLKIDCYY